MPAVAYNVLIEQGANWQIIFIWKEDNGTPINVGAYTAKLQIRTSALAKTAVLTLENGSGITITGNQGMFSINATPQQTAAIKNGVYVYDMEITSPMGVVTRLVQGKAFVSAEVTR